MPVVNADHEAMRRITQPWPTRDGRWFLPHFGLPNLRRRVLDVLACDPDPKSVANAVGKWNALELEAGVSQRVFERQGPGDDLAAGILSAGEFLVFGLEAADSGIGTVAAREQSGKAFGKPRRGRGGSDTHDLIKPVRGRRVRSVEDTGNSPFVQRFLFFCERASNILRFMSGRMR